jgi:ribosome biogenesis protein NSA1
LNTIQVANDSLGLRQPTRITSIDYLSTKSSAHIVTGTQLGDVRQYDTRIARRPVSDWKGLAKVGGIQVVKKGLSEK